MVKYELHHVPANGYDLKMVLMKKGMRISSGMAFYHFVGFYLNVFKR